MTEENNIPAFDKGAGDWEKLYSFMDENNFSCADLLACICAHLLNNYLRFAWRSFETKIMIQGVQFKIKIEPEMMKGNINA